MEMLTSSQQSDIDVVRKSLEEQHHKYTEELRSDLQKALQVSALALLRRLVQGEVVVKESNLKALTQPAKDRGRKLLSKSSSLFFWTGRVK